MLRAIPAIRKVLLLPMRIIPISLIVSPAEAVVTAWPARAKNIVPIAKVPVKNCAMYAGARICAISVWVREKIPVERNAGAVTGRGPARSIPAPEAMSPAGNAADKNPVIYVKVTEGA